MVDLISVLQGIGGVILFFASGYFISFVFFKKDEVDELERIVYSLTFSITIPPLVIFFLNFLLRMPVNTISVYIIYLIIGAASYAYSNFYMKNKAHKS
ncbi:MAG: hypothetical protein AABY04_03320 [Candidatus Micrarchaeota archaeon]